MEKTFFMIKPDGVQRGLMGQILRRIERRGFRIEQLQMIRPSRELLDSHYQHLRGKVFYPSLLDYMMSGPLLIGILSGSDVIASWRTMMGETNPKDALPGTIRGDFAQAPEANAPMMNCVHGSDSLDSARREIELWFGGATEDSN
ncbi:nucleoside-diphosphate kinase [Streptococcus pseudoporcinus]|uniref:Nucleoside diphosphate kinase n=1 Tax=Streptococcus pseudoporcinus LQ 940-04 TaxID=875093 RepID=G5KAM8_9STRE|nr:nucleoside-diphosphate kinase [Streptococcus pseudoporcinus]EFR44552.1 nucleoside diphosphate kinase [Streptococcus pseudoporcinus SPIN 20026]EHI65054.1 nucleoside pyrophosphate kinase [Streptococcus pseudoporcinus LQ 940-04]VEF93109.1 nucleoside diphosphate kinase [Streptococcus pseudoporcinus]